MSPAARIANRPAHLTLVVLPIGLWVSSSVCDVFSFLSGAPVWRALAFYTIAGGILGALVAAIPGLVDLLSIPEPRVRRVGWAHMLINASAVSLYGVDLWLRTWRPPVVLLPEVLSGLSLLLVNIAAWLVYFQGMEVEELTAARIP